MRRDKLVPLYRFIHRRWPELILVAGAMDRMWVTEDAFISFRSVESILHGCGPVFNCGIRVESYTHPLWLALLIVLRVIGGQALLPPLAALTGIALTVWGFLMVRRTFEGFGRHYGESELPIGYGMLACMPVLWDFASSGLETGLTIGWIGAVAWLLGYSARLSLGQNLPLWRLLSSFVVLGLGPLIRPDLAIVSAVSIAVFGWRARIIGTVHRLILAGLAAGCLPISYQVFRMGYFASMYPNTALAKEGFLSRWDQGWLYLTDLTGTYYLAIPFGLGMASLAVSWMRGVGNPGFRVLNPLLVAGVLHGLSIIRIGGDFMHGRMLIPALVMMGMSIGWVRCAKSQWLRPGVGILLGGWCLFSALFAHPPYGGAIGPDGIADERRWYAHSSMVTRPVSLADFRYHLFHRYGRGVGKILSEGKASAIYFAHIGIAPMVSGSDAVIIDPLGLNDYIGSRIRLTERGRPGHEKIAPVAWFFARYPDGQVARGGLGDDFARTYSRQDVEIAHQVLTEAEPLRALTHAVTDPISLELFMANLRRAREFSGLRIDPNPRDAAREFGISISDDRPDASMEKP